MNPRSWLRPVRSLLESVGSEAVPAHRPSPPNSQLIRLHELAAERATGALWLDAPSGGTVYLSGGRVTHIESALTPGVEALLLRPTIDDEKDWAVLVSALRQGATGQARAAAQALVESGAAPAAHAEILRRSALADAALAVLGMTLSLPEGTAVRFNEGQRHWWPPSRTWTVSEVLTEVRRRRSVLLSMTQGVRVWRPLRRLPTLATPAAPAVALTASQWDVVRLVDGVRTPLDIAWLRGHSVFATTVAVHQLARLGLLGVTGDAGPLVPRPARHVLSFLAATEQAESPMGALR